MEPKINLIKYGLLLSALLSPLEKVLLSTQLMSPLTSAMQSLTKRIKKAAQ